jgi:hypothetical protein
MAAGSGSAVAGFTDWLTRFGDAWEAAEASQMAALFVERATFQPTPFSGLLRGRRQIEKHFDELLAGIERVSFSAEVLGAGATYGVAHWRATSQLSVGLGPPIDRVRDGVVVLALDSRGRCTSMRWWWHETEEPPGVGSS